MNDWVYKYSRFVQVAALKLFAKYEVAGQENVPAEGALIIVSNHLGNIDPPMLVSSVPRRVYFLAKSGIFRGAFAKWFLARYGAFPVNREGTDVPAYRWVLEQLKNDRAVVLFPEGTRSQNGMREAKQGVAQIALRAGISILPVGITGTERMGSWARVFFPTGAIRVSIGKAFRLPEIEGKPAREDLDSMTNLIMGKIAELLPEHYQGAYAKKQVSTAQNRH